METAAAAAEMAVRRGAHTAATSPRRGPRSPSLASVLAVRRSGLGGRVWGAQAGRGRGGGVVRCSKTTYPEGLPDLELSEENVTQALEDARRELGTLFDEEAGMTGRVELVDLDGPMAVVRMSGRFWHKRADVLARVTAYVKSRVPELFEVDIEDPAQLDDSDKAF